MNFDSNKFEVQINKKVLQQTLIQQEAYLSYLQLRLCTQGITNSPTCVYDQELSYYLIDSFTRLGISSYRSKLSGVPIVLNIGYLKLMYLQLEESDFKDNLEIVIDYLETRNYVKQVYDYNNRIRIQTHINKSVPHVVKKLKRLTKLGQDVYSLKSLGTKKNIVTVSLDKEIRLTDSYYKYFTRITGFDGGVQWSFFKGFNRKSEMSYLYLVFEGYVKPTNADITDDIWGIYLRYIRKHGITVYQDLKLFLQEEKDHALNVIGQTDYKVKYVNDYGIGVGQELGLPDEVYLTDICFDRDSRKVLPLVNQINSLGGEFTKDVTKALLNDKGNPYLYEIQVNGVSEIYFKSKTSLLTFKNLNLEEYNRYCGYLNKDFKGNLNSERVKIVEVKNQKSLFKSMKKLEKGKIYAIK